MDEKSLEIWLGTRPRVDAITITLRAALRVFPIWGKSETLGPLNHGDLSRLLKLRRLLKMSVVSEYPSSVLANADYGTATVRILSDFAAAYADCAAEYAYNESYSKAQIIARTSNSDGAIADAYDAAGYAHGHASREGYAAFWREIEFDVQVLEAQTGLQNLPLWTIDQSDWFSEQEAVTLAGMAQDYGNQTKFWHRWLSTFKSGSLMNWDLQRDVALIEDAVWDDAENLAREIAEIEARYALEVAPDFETQLRQLPPSPPEVRNTFAIAVWQNREALPATLDAILGYCALEIERLQIRNYRDDDDRIEAQRQIGVLLRLHDAACRLAPMLITKNPMSDVEAIVPEKLSRLMLGALQEWPRKNVDDLVDSAYRFALTGAASTGLVMLGVAAPLAIAIGGAFSGGKKITDAIKAGVDSKGLT